MSSIFDSLTKNPELLVTVAGAGLGAYYGKPELGLAGGALAGQVVRSIKSKEGIQANDALKYASTGLALKKGASTQDAFAQGEMYGNLVPRQQAPTEQPPKRKVKKVKKKKKAKKRKVKRTS